MVSVAGPSNIVCRGRSGSTTVSQFHNMSNPDRSASPPAPSQSIQRQVRVLIGAEAQSGHAAPGMISRRVPHFTFTLPMAGKGGNQAPGCPEHNITDLTTLVKTRLRRMQ
jgi:hypothetical protein